MRHPHGRLGHHPTLHQMLLRRKRCPPSYQLLTLHHFSSSSSSSSPSSSSSSLGAFLFPNPADSWIAKVISTVFLSSPSSDAASNLAPLSNALSPPVAIEVIHRLQWRDPNLLLGFFEVVRPSLLNAHAASIFRLLISALCESGIPGSAQKVFDIMLEGGNSPDGPTLGQLVMAYAQAGELNTAFGLLSRAPEFKCRVNTDVFNNVMSQLVSRNQVDHAVGFFREQLRSGYFIPDTCSFNVVINGLCRLGGMDLAFELYRDMSRYQCSPDTITYNILIDGCCRTKQLDKGHELLRKIQSNGFSMANVVTYTSVIMGYCKRGEMMDAFDVFSEMVSFGVKPNSVTYNVLINGYGKAGDMASAISMFEKMLVCGCSPDIVTFTSLIDGCCRNGQVDDAMKFWCEMKEKSLWPNAYTFATILNGLCMQNRMHEARVILNELKERKDIVPRPFMYNPVIDCFCKSGNLDEANLIRTEMEDIRCFPDSVTYTILIIGHCMKGRMYEAVLLFHRMILGGCNPTHITTNVLVSCLLKAGMPDEATRIERIVFGKYSGGVLPSSGGSLSPPKASDVLLAI